MAPSVEDKRTALNTDHDSENVDGKKNEWDFGAPLKAHEEKDFKAKFEGNCHCGRVKYSLSRELTAKYCHCTTSQIIHGKPKHQCSYVSLDVADACLIQWYAISIGCYLLQGGYQLQSRTS